MAEGLGNAGNGREGQYFSANEEQYIRELEEEDAEQQLAIEKELSAQRLWLSFQESATAVTQLFRDCQQQAEHSSVWVPFHESASAVTQLYRGSADVCRQCIDCGVRYGQRRKTRDIISWAKKKKRHIKREELLAFLLDKPEPVMASSVPDGACPRVDDLNELTGPLSACCFNSSTSPSPRRRMVYKEDLAECDVLPPSGREISRKRPNSFSFDSASGMTECSPLTKRIRF